MDTNHTKTKHYQALLPTKHVHHDKWEGTPDQLIAAGIIEGHMLPGAPGRNKYSVTINGDPNQYTKRDESYIQILKRGKNCFIVKKGISQEEHSRRKTEYMLRFERRHANQRTERMSDSQRPEPKFQIEETVKIADDSGIMRVAKIKVITWTEHHEDDDELHGSYFYTVQPNPSQTYDHFYEEVVFKHIPAPATLLPNAAVSKVIQAGTRGRHPKNIASFRDAQRSRYTKARRLEDIRILMKGYRKQLNDLEREEENLLR